jgi:hypothetical protein
MFLLLKRQLQIANCKLQIDNLQFAICNWFKLLSGNGLGARLPLEVPKREFGNEKKGNCKLQIANISWDHFLHDGLLVRAGAAFWARRAAGFLLP